MSSYVLIFFNLSKKYIYIVIFPKQIISFEATFYIQFFHWDLYNNVPTYFPRPLLYVLENQTTSKTRRSFKKIAMQRSFLTITVSANPLKTEASLIMPASVECKLVIH